MSAQPPETPKPAEAPAVNPAAKLSDKLITLFGGAVFVAGLIAGRLLKKDDPDAAEAWGDGLKGFGFVCAMVGGAISIPGLTRLVGALGGKLLTGLVIGGALAAGSSILPGCVGSQYAAERKADLDWTPGPPCHIEVRLDGQRKPAVTVDAPEACEPAPDVCPVAPPVPQS